MSAPLTLPIPAATLRALVERLWQGEGGVARCAGVDPALVGAHVVERSSGGFEVQARFLTAWDTMQDRETARALSSLADALEADHGLVVDRTSGVRVVGYAAARVLDLDSARCLCGHLMSYHKGAQHKGCCRGGLGCECKRYSLGSYESKVVRMDSLAPWEEPRKSYDAAVRRAQQDRKAHLAPACPDVKRDREGWERWQREWGGGR